MLNGGYDFFQKLFHKGSIKKNSFSPSVVSVQQSGGITAHTVNFAKPDRHMDERYKQGLLSGLPKNKKIKIIIITTLGDTESRLFGEEIKSFLVVNGWIVDRMLGTIWREPFFGEKLVEDKDGNIQIQIGAKGNPKAR